MEDIDDTQDAPDTQDTPDTQDSPDTQNDPDTQDAPDTQDTPANDNPGFDVSELNRKLDAISEAVTTISKALAQLMTSGTPVSDNTPDEPADNPHADVKDIDELDL